jgi:hypothetical protein
LVDGFRGNAPDSWAKRLLRGLLSLLGSAAFVYGIVFFGIRFHLWWLSSLLWPGFFLGVLFGAVFVHLFPDLLPGGGGWFSGMGEGLLAGGIADWLLYAFLFYQLLEWFALRKSNNVDDNVD